jgi:glyoxylase-like metal-dependent hydrolase (beta-lactamase superfamily II)
VTTVEESARVEVTGTAQKAAWAAGVLPPVEEVRPGLWSIPVPIPDSPLRYLLVYAFESRGGLVVVDAGWDSEESWDALRAGFAAFGARPDDVRGILVTHMHPDHFGLAPRLRAASGAWLAMHEADAALVETSPEERLVRDGERQMAELGCPDELCQGVGRFPGPVLGPDERPEILLDDGDRVPVPGWDLRAVWTPGHTPGHL